MRRSPPRTRRGVTLVEVVIAMVVVLVVVLMIAMALPRNRELARANGCKRNLMLIGQAVAYSDTAMTHLPTVPAFGVEGEPPLSLMLGQLGLGDFSPLADPKARAAGFKPGSPPREHFIAGFVCPSDPNAIAGRFSAPVSYRANTGATPEGTGGPFAPGQVVSMAEVQAADGTDFTAGFAERLVGSGSGAPRPLNDYLRVPGPVGLSACPSPKDESPAWRLDAGSSWAKTGWDFTLYNHSLAPNDSPSCLAENGRTARMGASSTHEGRVLVLMLGGSVRRISTKIDAEVWRKMGTINDGPPLHP